MKVRHFIVWFGCLLLALQSVWAQNKLYIPEKTECIIGETCEIPVYLDNTDVILGIQIDLDLESIQEYLTSSPIFKLSDRLSGNFTIDYEGSRVLIYPQGTSGLSSGSGEIFSFSLPVKAIETLVDQTYSIGFKKVVLSKSGGNAADCTTTSGNLLFVKGENYPDFIVQDVEIKTSQIAPNGEVSVSWLVKNIGEVASLDGWKESIYLVNKGGTEEVFLGSLNQTDLLTAGQSVSRNATFQVKSDPGLDGEVYVKVVLTPYADSGELESATVNNTRISNTSATLSKVLTLSLSSSIIPEEQTNAVQFFLYRSGKRTSDESFTITNSNTERLTVPTTVVIPMGQSGVMFSVSPINDSKANADSMAVLTVSGNSYPEVKQTVWIEDDEKPYLKMSVEKEEAKEGDSFTLTIQREWTIAWPLTVTLSSDHPKRFSDFPSEIVIPANVNQQKVTVKVADDDLPGLDDEVVFTASAPGHEFDLTSERFVKVIDNDVPNITLELSTSTTSEATQTIVATLKRTGVTDNKVTVNLTDNGGGRISMPSSVILEAGVVEKEFAIETVDNTLKDGDKTITIKGAIYISSCNCLTSGTEAGVFEKQITVLDDDNAAIKSVASKTTLLEGEKGTITVSVNEILSQDLRVQLTCENTDLKYPSSVTIPAGESSVNVEVEALTNNVVDGNRVVTFVIDAGIYGKSTCWFNITDQTLPDAVITGLMTDKEIAVQSSAKVSISMRNEGATVLPSQTKVSVYLSSNNELTGSVTALGALYTQNELAVGESITLEKMLTFPEKTGNYYLIAVVNEEQSKEELSYMNNNSTPFALTLLPLYTVQVSLDKSVIKTGESVVITGQVNGNKTTNVPVDLYIINNGYRQVISVKTDNSGVFQETFTPESWQLGHFSVGACYPEEGLETEMAGFDLYGLKKANSDVITWEVFMNEKTTGSIILTNPGNRGLNNITTKIISQPQNCQISFAPISSIAANSTVELQYEVTGTAVSSGTDWEKIQIQVTSAEGAVLNLDIYYYCRSYTAQLDVNERSINTTMTIGTAREYPITVVNTGKGETGEIQVVLPDVDWMSLVSPAKMSSLGYGESATILLRLSPNADMEANVAHTGQFAVNCANGSGLPISYRITPVSSKTGILVVDVCDEYTYYTDEKPHVSDAQVRVTMINTNTVVAEGTTDSNGLFTKELPAGYYTLEVTADKHDSYKNTILVDPGIENKEVVNLSFQAITYSWTVVETEIEDEYEIKLETKYETNVPTPVVVTEIPEYVPADKLSIGESYVFEAKLTNKGLITANNVFLIFPQDLNVLEFELLVEDNFDLKAQESKVIPVKMTRKGSVTKAADTDNSDMPCTMVPVTSYSWKCNEEYKWVKVPGDTKLRENCSHEGGSWSNPGSGVGGFGHYMDDEEFYDYIVKRNQLLANTLSPIYSVMENVAGGMEHLMCNPLWRCLRDVALFASEFIPGSDCPSTLISCGVSALASASDQYLDDAPSAIANVKTAGGCLINVVTDCLVPFVPGVGQVGIGFKMAVDAVNVASSLSDAIASCRKLLPLKQTKASVSIVDEFNDVNDMALEEMEVLLEIIKEILGREGVYNYEAADLNKVRQYLLDSNLENWTVNNLDLMNLRPDYISIDDYSFFIQRIKNTYDYYTKGIVSDNYISHERLLKYQEVLDRVEKYALNMGYSSFGEMYKQKEKELIEYLNEPSSSVCSSISLQFSQAMVMTRQAFLGTLTVNNTHETNAIENIKLNLSITDEDGNIATDHEFQINTKSLENLKESTNGGWTLVAQKLGIVKIEFIPTKYAAPTEPKEYTFGGTLSYVDPFTGLEVTRDLYPVTLTVKPSPNLTMDYFVQRDILGDDPLTEEVEPMVPSEFSLLIHNVGVGDAMNVRMTTKQPEIVDNEKGLLVDFNIKTSQLNGEEEIAVLSESVQTDFGTIKAGKTAYAQWWLISSLLGHFTEYKVEATHVTSYDNPDLSLLDEVRVHELIRGIRVDETVTPKVTGFMVNDITDAEDFPDMMYLTDGTVAPVVKATVAEMVQVNETTWTLEVTPSTNGWNYINIPDPTAGRYRLISVNESTNLDTRKVWQTDRTLRDGKDPKSEYLIHVVDYFDEVTTKASSVAGNFTLVFEARPEIVLAVESITGLPDVETVATTAVGKVTVKFNKPVSQSSVTAEMIDLYCQGEKIVTENIKITKQDDQTYILDISNVTNQEGCYTLTILTSKIEDSDGFTGGEDKTVSWTQLAGGKVKLMVTVNPAEAGTVSPASTEVDYNSEVTLKAAPATGYQFKNWTTNGKVISTDNPFQYVALTDQTIVANFEPISYSIEINYDIAQGSVSLGTGYYEYNSSLELIATPNEGYRFVGWFINDKLVSTEELYIYKVSGSGKLEARFEVLNGDSNNSDDLNDPNNPTEIGNVETLVIKVYPTRVEDYVHVGTLPAKSRLILFTLSGMQVKHIPSCEGDVEMYMGDQPAGIYLLYILAGEEQKRTIKLIKK